MKNPKITLTKDGPILIDAPEKPVLNDRDNQWYKETGGYKDPNKWYTQALEKSINEGVKFKEPEQVIIKMPQEVWELEQGKLYDLPEGYQARIEIQSDRKTGNEETFMTFQVAILEPLTKQEQETIKEALTTERERGIVTMSNVHPKNWVEDAILKSGDDNPVPEKKIYVKCTCLNSLEYSNCAKNCEQVQAENESTPVIEQKEAILDIEPIPLKAGDKRVLINGGTCKVDFRIISEENYQLLLQPESKQLTPTWQICPKCNGTGMAMNFKNQIPTTHDTCDVCNGTKIISIVTGLPPNSNSNDR